MKLGQRLRIYDWHKGSANGIVITVINNCNDFYLSIDENNNTIDCANIVLTPDDAHFLADNLYFKSLENLYRFVGKKFLRINTNYKFYKIIEIKDDIKCRIKVKPTDQIPVPA